MRSAYQAGLTLLPVAEDGTKRPALPEWKTYQQQRPTPADMRQWNFAERAGFGMVAGPVSGYCESWDFDDAPTFEAFLDAAAATGLADVIQRIRDGYEDQTPNGGRRWIVRYPPDVTWADTVYARRPGRPGEKPVVTLIETTLFAVLAPSQWLRASERASVCASERQLRHDRRLHPRRTGGGDCARAQLRSAAPTRSGATTDGERRSTGRRLQRSRDLARDPDAARLDRGRHPRRARRTGDDRRSPFGISASTNHETGLLWMFTSSTTFAPDVSYSKFGAYARARAWRRLCRRGEGAGAAGLWRDGPLVDRRAVSAGRFTGRSTAPHDSRHGVSD